MEKNSHKILYKTKIPDIEELRRRRGQNAIELRKLKKEESLLKRRNIRVEDSLEECDLYISSMDTVENLNVQDLYNQVTRARKYLSTSRNPIIDRLINDGIIPKLVYSLQKDELPLLQFEACWALTNIASGSSAQSNAVLNSGALPKLVDLLSSPHINVCEQALWVLGNLIGESAGIRDKVLYAGALPPLLLLLHSISCSRGSSEGEKSFLRTLTWVVLNICRHKNPPPSDDVIQQLLPGIGRLIENQRDSKVLLDALSAVSHLTAISVDKIQLTLDSGIVPSILPFLAHSDPDVKTAGVRALGNTVTGDDEQTQRVLDYGLLAYFGALLTQPDTNVVKESLWLLSNVAAGNEQQIQAMLGAGLLPTLVNILKKSPAIVQKEALFTVTNMMIGGSREQVNHMVEQGIIPLLCSHLSLKDAQVRKVILEALKSLILVHEPDPAPIFDILDACQGLDKIEHLFNESQEGPLQELCKWIILHSSGQESLKEEESMCGLSNQHLPEFSF